MSNSQKLRKFIASHHTLLESQQTCPSHPCPGLCQDDTYGQARERDEAFTEMINKPPTEKYTFFISEAVASGLTPKTL
jgi:hypothetical protein